MRALVVYESMYGNTHAVAEQFAKGLSSTFDTTVVPVGEATADLVAASDLVVVGGPTHAHTLTRGSTRRSAISAAQAKQLSLDASAAGPGLREWFPAISPREHAEAIAFDTRVRAPAAISGRAGLSIIRRLRRRGFTKVIDAGSFFVDKNNELLPGEAERATVWAAEFANQA
jgi:Flavodoxin